MSDTDVLYQTDGNAWHYNPETRLWECQCRHCHDEPDLAEKLSFADMYVEYGPMATWNPAEATGRSYGRHSDTRHLDEPAENVTDLMARVRQFPTIDLDVVEAEKRAA